MQIHTAIKAQDWTHHRQSDIFPLAHHSVLKYPSTYSGCLFMYNVIMFVW